MSRLRNIGVFAHVDAGKTTLTEQVLHLGGVVRSPGSVDRGTALTDWMAEERDRGITITATLVHLAWRGVRINLVDTPGHVDFTMEVERCMRVLDGGVFVVSAVEGVQSQTEVTWRQADRCRLPRIVFVNKLDREGADFQRVLGELAEQLGARPIPLVVPRGGPGGVELLDVLEGGVASDADEAAMLELAREAVADALLEDDAEITAWLEGRRLPARTSLLPRLRSLVVRGEAVPVFAGVARTGLGVEQLLDAVVDLLPAPEACPRRDAEGRPLPQGVEAPFLGLAFKVAWTRSRERLVFVRVYGGRLAVGDDVLDVRTGRLHRVEGILRVQAERAREVGQVEAGDLATLLELRGVGTGDVLADPAHPVRLLPIQPPEPVILQPLELVRERDAERLRTAVERLVDEDPSLRWHLEEETGRVLLAGMGELHLEIARSRLRREFGLELVAGELRVAWRETPAQAAVGRGRVDRVVGGRGHHADLEVHLRPARRGSGQAIEGGVPSVLGPAEAGAVREGITTALARGPRGFPVTDLAVTWRVRDLRESDATPEAFAEAARQAVEDALVLAGTLVLEPIMGVEVSTPFDYMGAVLGDLHARRGTVEGMVAQGARQLVRARVPLAELPGYATALRSVTRGRATCTLRPIGFAPVPASLQERISAPAGT